jgi:N-methylhydantoinase B
VSAIDAVTFEVLRHRLATVVDEAAQVLRQVSGSPVATEVADCNTALMDAGGNCVMMGYLIPSHALGAANTARYVLERFQENPGFGPGDMFLSNDPYRIGGHQNCVVLVAPIHHGGELIAWSGAGIHLADMGGPIPGQVAVGAHSAYDEPPIVPPVRIVEGGVLRQDIADEYLGRSRSHGANAMDLRAKIAANNSLARRFAEMVERYGAETLTAALGRTVEFTEQTIRDRLAAIPDGYWRAETFLDYDNEGSVSLYRCGLDLTKSGGEMVLDFRDSSPAAPGVVNCTRQGLEMAVVHTMLTLLTWDLPKCPAGVAATYRVQSRPGTFVDAQWPAGVSKATTSGMQCASKAVNLAVSRMFASSEAFRGRVVAPSFGYSAVLELSGINQHGQAFAAPLLDIGLPSGSPAFSFRDGQPTAGGIGSAGSSMANVEAYEQRYPLLYLCRRELADTGGAGAFTGGAGLYMMVTPHDVARIPDVVFHTHGTELPASMGLHGGLPGSTNSLTIKRGTDVNRLLAGGLAPIDFDAIEGAAEALPGICRTYLADGDVYRAINQGGGGYGDPLDREPEGVAADVALGFVTSDLASRIYGLALDASGAVDAAATEVARATIRQIRLAVALPPAVEVSIEATAGHGRPVTDRVALTDSGLFGCSCGRVLGPADRPYHDYLARLDEPCSAAGPYVLSQAVQPLVHLVSYICPGCGALTEVELALS